MDSVRLLVFISGVAKTMLEATPLSRVFVLLRSEVTLFLFGTENYVFRLSLLAKANSTLTFPKVRGSVDEVAIILDKHLLSFSKIFYVYVIFLLLTTCRFG
jgi:hypothetical protein